MVKRPEDIYPALSEAYNAGDLEALVSLYDPKAVFVIKPGRVTEGLDCTSGVRRMIDTQIRQRNCNSSNSLLRLAFVAASFAAWLMVPIAHIDSIAVAAEVDAIGLPAPVGFADIVERVKPAVVGVRVKIEEVTTSDETQKEAPRPPRSLFGRFFRHFGMPIPDAPVARSGIALGSGFFISGDGYVVTNNHVVANGTSFEVTTDSGNTYQAKVIGTDPQTDLALIKVGGGTDFPYVRLSAEVPRIGDWVIAVGNPFGLGARSPPVSSRRADATSAQARTKISFRSTRR
jgi:S1-C subfamily serine protease